MPTFEYKAKDGPVQTVLGELVAESRAVALAQLDARGLSPIWVREKSPSNTRGRRGLGLGRVRSREITVFTHQLSSLLRAGVPILRALQTLAGQTDNPRLSKLIEGVAVSIRDGSMLSDALAEWPALFPDLYVNMVRSGESGGALAEVLARLAAARDREADIRRKVQAALAYPTLVLAVGAATVFVLLTFFVPRVVELFSDYRDLPLPTRILIGVSGFFAANWYWIVLFVLLGWAVLKRLASLERGRLFFDRIVLQVPLLGRFTVQTDTARFCRTLALLIEGGIPVGTGLQLGAGALSNTVLRGEMESIREGTMLHGRPFSDGIGRSTHFPAMMRNMVAVGEEGGRLEESLVEVAVFYEREVDQLSRLAISLLEPIMILGVGCVVGFIVAAMLLPIFQMGSAL